MHSDLVQGHFCLSTFSPPRNAADSRKGKNRMALDQVNKGRGSGKGLPIPNFLPVTGGSCGVERKSSLIARISDPVQPWYVSPGEDDVRGHCDTLLQMLPLDSPRNRPPNRQHYFFSRTFLLTTCSGSSPASTHFLRLLWLTRTRPFHRP